jgi:hypothetical protein
MRLTKPEVRTLCLLAAFLLPVQIWVLVASFKEAHPTRFKGLGGIVLFWLIVSIGVWVTKKFGKVS